MSSIIRAPATDENTTRSVCCFAFLTHIPDQFCRVIKTALIRELWQQVGIQGKRSQKVRNQV